MFKKYFYTLLIISVCFSSSLLLAHEVQKPAPVVGYCQWLSQVFDRPVSVVSQTLVSNADGALPKTHFGDIYSLTRIYSSDELCGSFYSPIVEISKLDKLAFNDNLKAIDSIRLLSMLYKHPLPAEFIQYFEASLAHERTQALAPEHLSRYRYFYSPNTSDNGQGPFQAILTMYDGTARKGELNIRTPLERYIDEDFPERKNTTPYGIIELSSAYKNPRVEGSHEHFELLGKEVATYIDTRYLQRDTPVVIRLLTSWKGFLLFTDTGYFNYGFKKWKTHTHVDPRTKESTTLYILEMSGEDFVKRWGSWWSQWQESLREQGKKYDDLPYDPLWDREKYLEEIQVILHRLRLDSLPDDHPVVLFGNRRKYFSGMDMDFIPADGATCKIFLTPKYQVDTVDGQMNLLHHYHGRGNSGLIFR